jgi:hypothetical protein
VRSELYVAAAFGYPYSLRFWEMAIPQTGIQVRCGSPFSCEVEPFTHLRFECRVARRLALII